MTAAHPRRTGHPGYKLTQPRTSTAAADVRRLVRLALSAWSLETEAEKATLLMSELFTNAVRHARGSMVRIVINRPSADRVYLAVIDLAPRRLPELHEPGPADADGRGLLVVGRLADRWGYDLLGPGARPWGKRVWAELKVRLMDGGEPK
ncbi:ATP-binding protein [Streptomyces sp. MST-110588]|uniref:ATP-binding protein n=1 Tax=Streptomyces sp. MST-110588 TaxID=2833628 RepID=UPI001F5DD04B|nr:ATP-binding protein [Streptomyces sp. MST-110588]